MAQAQSALAQAKNVQAQAAQALQQAQANYAQLTNGAKDPATLQANLTKAKQNLAQARANLQAANQAVSQAQAKANLITDAKVYGNVVEVNDAKMYAKEALPSLTLKNATADDPTQSELDGLMLEMATMPGDTIPTGTKASFKDSTKALADSQVPGDYVEDVLVTFPDDSTVTKQIKLHVDKAVSDLPSGWKIVNGHVVDANGNVIAGYNVDANGNVVKVSDENGSKNGSEKIATMSVTPSRSALHNGQLPQTGNTEGNILAVAGLAIATMFSFGFVYKKQR